MAALRPCPVRITAPASSDLTRSQPRYAPILSLDRSNTMLKICAPLHRSSTQLKISHGIRADSGTAGQPVSPDPEEFFLSLLTPEQKKIWEEGKKIAKGPPHSKGAALSWTLCEWVRHASVLASKVVDCAALRLGSPDEISLHTTTQTMRAYVSVFVRTAEDNHHKKVTMETFISVLGALQGVASISHIWAQDTLAYLTLIVSKDTSSEYQIIGADIDRVHLEYKVGMNNLKDKLKAAHPVDVCKLLEPAREDPIRRTRTCVTRMIASRKVALRLSRGAVARAPSDDK